MGTIADLERGSFAAGPASPGRTVDLFNTTFEPNMDPSLATDPPAPSKEKVSDHVAQHEAHQLSATPSAVSNHASTTEAGSPLIPTRAQRFRSELRRITMHFTPSWFSVIMGTGITAILLHQLPYQFHGLGIISNVIFGLNVLLFLLFLGISIARYVIWPQLFQIMLFHPTQSLFLGTLPMGLATIISMCTVSAAPAWNSTGFVNFVWALWWFDAALSLAICVGLPLIQFTRHVQSLDKITGVWFLPVVTTIVCASTGGLVASILPPSHARLTLTVCYVLWGTGFCMAFILMPLYYARQAIYKIPPSQLIVSTFLPIGPCGQGAFGLVQFASVLYDLAQRDNTALISPKAADPATARIMATAIYAVSAPVALVIWGLGIVWLVLAVSSIVDLWLVSELSFNLGFWGLVFPIGTMAIAAIKFGSVFDSGAFRVIGTVLALVVLCVWIFVAAMTLRKALIGKIFFSPCLAEMCDDTTGEPPKYLPPARKYQYEARPATANTFNGSDGRASRSRSRLRSRVGAEVSLARARRWISSTTLTSTSPFDRSRSRGRPLQRSTATDIPLSSTTIPEASSSSGHTPTQS